MDDKNPVPKNPQPAPAEPHVSLGSDVHDPTNPPRIIKHSEAFGHLVYPAEPVKQSPIKEAKPESAQKPLAPVEQTQPNPDINSAKPPISVSVWPPVTHKPTVQTEKTATDNTYIPPPPLRSKPVTTKSLIIAAAAIVFVLLFSYLLFAHSVNAPPAKGISHSTSTSASSTTGLTDTTKGTPSNPSGDSNQNPTTSSGVDQQIQGDENYCSADPLLNC